MILFDLEGFLEDLNLKINNFLDQYTSNPVFWVVTAILIFIIGCWAIKYLNKK